MADWALPQLSDLKVDVLSMLKGREVDAYTLAENALNPPVGAIRWNRTLNMFQSWNGTAWVDLVIALPGGGTGGSNIDEVLDSLNLGTMSTQNSNAVNITGGSITGLSNFAVAGNVTIGGVLTMGSTPTTVTNSAGQVLGTAIVNGINIAYKNLNESITQTWTFWPATQFQSEIHIANNGTATNGLRIVPNGTSAGLCRISFSDATNSSCPAYIQAYEAGFSASHFLIANNYYSPDGGISTRRNTAQGGSYLRLAVDVIDLVGINASGTQVKLLGLGAGISTFGYGVVQLANSDQTAELRLASNGTCRIAFYVSGGLSGQIVHANTTNYYDATVHTWRSGNGSVSYATLSSDGRFAAYHLQTNSGWILNAEATVALTLNQSAMTFRANEYQFYNFDATVNTLAIVNGVVTTYNRLNVHGGQGTGMSMWKSGANAVFTCHQGSGTSGSTIWHNAADTEQLMILNGNVLTPHGGLSLNSGSFTYPAIRLINQYGLPNVGIYFNTTLGTLEFGSRMGEIHAGIVRCYTAIGEGMIDFYVKTNIMLALVGTRGVVSGVDAGYFLGDSVGRWHTVFALAGAINTSDIRLKDIHGDLNNVLPYVEAIQPIIGSFKEELRPETMKDNPHWTEHFPTFSAQDIKNLIDRELRTRIVDDTNPEQLGMNYSRLIPVLWQAVRELAAKVKALENN